MINKKIIKVQLGYNPNSSSIGTMLYAFPKILLFSLFLFQAITIFIIVKIRKGSGKHDDEK